MFCVFQVFILCTGTTTSPVKSGAYICSENPEQLLWTAPEILRMIDRPPIGTQKGDVYSFGVISQELVTMTKPYELERQYQTFGGATLVYASMSLSIYCHL